MGEIMSKRALAALRFLAMASVATGAAAQVNPYKDPTPGVTGYRAEVLAELRVQEDKFTRLAAAIPEEKYAWKPAPAGIDVKNLEKPAVDKAMVLGTLADSFAHLKQA